MYIRCMFFCSSYYGLHGPGLMYCTYMYPVVSGMWWGTPSPPQESREGAKATHDNGNERQDVCDLMTLAATTRTNTTQDGNEASISSHQLASACISSLVKAKTTLGGNTSFSLGPVVL